MKAIDTLRSLLELSLPNEARERVEQCIRLRERVLVDEMAFQQLGSRLDCGLLVLDERGIITYANDRLADLLRAPRSALVGEFVATWLPEDAKATFFRQFSQRRRGGSAPYSVGLQRADKSFTNVSVIPFPRFDEQGSFRGTFAMMIEESEAPAERTGEEGGEDEKAPSAFVEAVLEELSPREREVVDTLMAGQDVNDIAQTFHISEHTVRNHIKSIYRKLGVHSRTELMRRVLES